MSVIDGKDEIMESLRLSNFSMKCIGLSLDKATSSKFNRRKIIFLVSFCSVMYHVFADVVFLIITFKNSPSIEDVVPYFHPFGYGLISVTKVFVLWLKKDVFAKLIDELAEIWPMPPLEENVQELKTNSLKTLNTNQKWYFSINALGVWFYNLTPIVVYSYQHWQGNKTEMGYVWVGWYPFDKHQPIAHVFVYIFEMFAGTSTVWVMLGSDLLFSGMSSHIALLLKILQHRIVALGTENKTEEEHYNDIMASVKLHQRLIRYCKDIEAAFSFVNLVNIVMSSVNICCVCFVIVLLEPLFVISNKLFLGSVLIQTGVLCWYAEEIFHANGDIAQAAYNSQWYTMTPRCRRAILLLIRRSQKPLAFTAMGFTNISLVTYSAILTRSYSYFALLYQMYDDAN